MKKIFIILTFAILATTMSLAQDLTSKKGENYLPESDEWSIGFDATSLLNYFGNFLNSNATVPTVSSPYSNNSAAFYGKKLIDDNTAWRARMELGINSNSISNIQSVRYNESEYFQTNEVAVYDTVWGFWDVITPNSVNVVVTEKSQKDVIKTTNSNFALALWLGKEWRRGSTRLQGVYGAEVGLGYSSSETTIDYGIDAALMYRDLDNPVSERTTEIKNGSTFMLGARAFLGAEYFILPKISLGVEYGWGLALTSTGSSSETIETTTEEQGGYAYWDLINDNHSNAVDTQNSPNTYTTNSETIDGESSGSFSLGNQLRGSIAVNFYF
jgi:hypothetical protein